MSCFFLLAFLTGWIVQRSVVLHDAFLETAGRSPLTIAAEAGTGWWQTIRQEETEPFRLLLLGIDEVAGSGRSAILTDTLMMITYQPAENTVSTLSIPRDVYHPEYATKVNALYFYGTERNPAAPEKFTSQVLTEMTGVDFDGVVVVSLEDVQDLIDLVGGVTVDVPHTFTDDRFPRSGVDVSVETDPAVLYETITFEAGEQTMDGETALKYIRTRKSADPEEGTDEARTRRQRQVLSALFAKMTDPHFIANPYTAGRLYRWYADRYQDVVSLYDGGVLAGYLWKTQQIPEFASVELPVTASSVATDSATLFVHPPTEKYGQWVYEPVDPTWQQLQQFVRQNNL
ncbi:LCP family protein [Candidatus Woesebacteria bacterium]|nr:LCP family protein [Candidatus Woesebacteria bacterium]MCD8545953.1 LCP family protein [Candidatus Woesebacteria bacterium]